MICSVSFLFTLIIMSNILVCLTEPLSFPAQNVKKTEISFKETSDSDPFKTEETKMQSDSLVQDENKCSMKEGSVFKQAVSRKREASTVLMECVKRRDNMQNIDFASLVPFHQSNKDSLNNSELYNFSPFVCKTNTEFESVCTADASSNTDLSDSTSTTDSGIDILSKSSSPCHSIDTLSR